MSKFNRGSISEIQDNLKKLEKKGGFESDMRYWTTQHVMGPEGVGVAVVRFLPAPDGENQDIVKFHTYNYDKNGKKYFNNGRDSIGLPDPAQEFNIPIWQDNSLTKEEKLDKIFNKKEYYVANIYVVSDPNKRENEGKVFLWKFGPAIYKKIKEQFFPEFETDPVVDIYHPEHGADFELRVTAKEIPNGRGGKAKVPNYDKAKFASPSKRWDGDSDEFEAIWTSAYSLAAEISEDKFRSYEELKKLVDRVTGSDEKPKRDENQYESRESRKPANEKRNNAEEMNDEIPNWGSDDDDDDGNESVVEDSGNPWDEPETPSKEVEDEADDWFAKLK